MNETRLQKNDKASKLGSAPSPYIKAKFRPQITAKNLRKRPRSKRMPRWQLGKWPLQTTGRIGVRSASPRKRRMMFRSEALRTRYIIRSDEPWPETSEPLRSKPAIGVALLTRFESSSLESDLARYDSIDGRSITRSARDSRKRTCSVILIDSQGTLTSRKE